MRKITGVYLEKGTSHFPDLNIFLILNYRYLGGLMSNEDEKRRLLYVHFYLKP